MIQRCTNENNKSYPHYGGRGISVCEEWRNDFWAFVADVGDRPEGTYPSGFPLYTLERIDNDGNYEPNNVKWATRTDQNKNRRDIAYSGSTRDKLGRFS